jgi:hypothetical protein
MPQDTFQEAKERYDEAREAMRENHDRMRADLAFSNPADPQQWDPKTVKDRDGRPTLTLDQTNQFIQQVVNDGRQNPPSMLCVPVDGGADVQVALQLNGWLRNIEYQSRATTHYATGMEYSARVGLGWLRVVPVVCDRERNYQEPRIFGIQDVLSACLDPDSEEFDGSDAEFGFVEANYSERKFKRKWPKASVSSFGDTNGWFSEKGVRIAEYFKLLEKKRNMLMAIDPRTAMDGRDPEPMPYTEDEYWALAKELGTKPEVIGDNYEATVREVKWYKMSGVEILDETDFPCQWIGLAPIYGHMIVIDGKRYICGLTRRLMNGQKFHNYQMSSLAESLLEQPKSPIIVPARGIAGPLKDHWAAMNVGNPAFLPYEDIDEDGDPIAAPQRLNPPQFPAAYANGAQLGVQEMQASVGMYKSNLGAPSNAVSGKAKLADQAEGDTSTYHYRDNRNRTIEHVGRMCIDMTCRLTDTARTIRLLGQDGKASFMRVDPQQKAPMRRDSKGKVVAINPSVGKYDVRVKVGPHSTTMREELKDRLTQLGAANPNLAAALAPLLVRLDDLPEAEKVARICMALLPPNVQAAYNDEDAEDGIPPQLKMQMQQQAQQLQQATQMVQQLTQELNLANDKNAQAQQGQAAEDVIKSQELQVRAAENDTARIVAETDRIKAEMERAQLEHALAQPPEGELDEEAQEQLQLQALLQAMAALFDVVNAQSGQSQELAERLEAAQQAIEQAQQQTAEAVGTLADIVTRPRVATLETDESGMPVRAVSTIEGS